MRPLSDEIVIRYPLTVMSTNNNLNCENIGMRFRAQTTAQANDHYYAKEAGSNFVLCRKKKFFCFCWVIAVAAVVVVVADGVVICDSMSID